MIKMIRLKIRNEFDSENPEQNIKPKLESGDTLNSRWIKDICIPIKGSSQQGLVASQIMNYRRSNHQNALSTCNQAEKTSRWFSHETCRITNNLCPGKKRDAAVTQHSNRIMPDLD